MGAAAGVGVGGAVASGAAGFPDTGMTRAPRRRGLPGPAPEGAGEGAQLGVLQDRCRDLAERHVGVFQQLARDLEADLVGHLPEREAFHAQVTVQGAAVHREEAGDRGGGAGVPEQFGPKHPAQILGEVNQSRGPTAARLPCGWMASPSLLPPFGGPAAAEPFRSSPPFACLTA